LQSRYTFPHNPLVNGYAIRAGDPSTSLRAGRIYLRQETYQAARPGIVLKFTSGTDTRNNRMLAPPLWVGRRAVAPGVE